MNGVMNDEFQSRSEIEEPFEQFVASYSDFRILPPSSTVQFSRSPGTDVCSSSSAAVRTTLWSTSQQVATRLVENMVTLNQGYKSSVRRILLIV